jgi:MtN3 and saliva related transmembrane protein
VRLSATRALSLIFSQLNREERMDGILIGILGIAATVLSTFSLMPQVVRTWRTRSAKDISTAWLVVAMSGMMIWGVYGCLIGSQPLIWANAVAFIQCGSILYIKLQSEREAVAGRR